MPSTHVNAESKFIAAAFVSWPLNEAERLVLAKNASTPQTLHETIAQILTLCDQWRSLDEHTAIAIEKMPVLQPHAQQIRLGLEQMVTQGLLVDAKRLSEEYGKSDSYNPTPDKIQTLYIRTFCCPQALERLLKSAQLQSNVTSLKKLVIIDDARSEADIDRSRDLLATYSQILPLELVHITRADRDQLADAIADASGADAQELRWWLNGDSNDPEITAGASFNTALLLSAGTTTAIMDDDAQLTPYGGTQAPSDMSIAGSEEVHWSMYASHEDMDKAWPALELDPLAAHSCWLGQSLPSLLDQTASAELFWSTTTSGDLHKLSPQAKVKLSINGLLGDPGTGGASWLFALPAEQLAPWLKSEADYRQLSSKRLMARQPQGHKLLPRHSLLSPLVGVDNSELMPPTLPNGRGEDLLFAELVCCVYPDTLFAQLPWMLKHIPEKAREFDRASLLRPSRMSTCRLLTESLRELRHAVPSASPETRLQWLGHSMNALSQVSEGTLANDYHRHLSADRAYVTEKVTKNIQALQPPAYLAEDMLQLVKNSCQGSATDQQELDSTGIQYRKYANLYSQALNSWQKAWEYCQQLDESKILNMTKV